MALLDKLKFWEHKDKGTPLPSTPYPNSPPPLSGDQGWQPPKEQSAFGQPPSGFDQVERFGQGFERPDQRASGHPTAPTQHHEDLSLGSPARPQHQGRDQMELLQIKLDAIKNSLDTINLRLERLEHAAGIDR